MFFALLVLHLSIYLSVFFALLVLRIPFRWNLFVDIKAFVVSGGYSFFALSVRAFRMSLLNFVHSEIGNRGFPVGFASIYRLKSPYKPTVQRGQE